MKRIGLWMLLVLAALLETFYNPFHKEKKQLRGWQDIAEGIIKPLNEAYGNFISLNDEGPQLAGRHDAGDPPVRTASLTSAIRERKAELKNILPNDPLLNREYAVLNDGSFSRAQAKPNADIRLAEGWEIEQGSAAVTVAVLDGGIDMDDPEFAGRIWQNSKEIPGNNKDDDNNGYVDDVHGWDFIRWDNEPEDGLGHGTNVAGIIGANANNGIGYAGVDWHCKIMPLKVVDDHGHGDYTAWARAVKYAVDNGARVINMSLGGNIPTRKLRKAIEYAYKHNVVVVAAMMNTNSDTKYYPAAYAHVIAVGATGPDDKRAVPFSWSENSGSNYGGHIDVVAPGGYIYGPTITQSYDVCWSGTSQATPYVSGLAALLIAQDPSRKPDDIARIITATADDQVGDPAEDKPGWDPYYGYGRIDVYRALTYSRQVAGR